jgi:hypothetical protein
MACQTAMMLFLKHCPKPCPKPCLHEWQVTALALGKGRQQRDRIFYAAGNTVRGKSREAYVYTLVIMKMRKALQQIFKH